MPKIAGFSTEDVRMASFAPASLFQPGYHLRSQRAVLFLLSMLTSLATLAVACYSLAQYAMLKTNIESNYANTTLYQMDLTHAEVALIVFSFLIFCFFAFEFFLLAQFPNHIYTKTGLRIKLGLASCLTLALFGAGIANSLFVAKHSAVLTGPTLAELDAAVAQYSTPNLMYGWFTPNLVYVVIGWFAWLFVAASTTLIALSNHHDAAFGPQVNLAEEGGKRSSMKEDRPVGLTPMGSFSKAGFVQTD